MISACLISLPPDTVAQTERHSSMGGNRQERRAALWVLFGAMAAGLLAAMLA